jgi:hypothetical protein
MTDSNKLRWCHMAGKLASSNLLLLQRSLWAQSSTVFHDVGLILSVPKGIRSSFNYLIYFVFKSFCVLIKINSHVFMLVEVILYIYYQYVTSCWNQISILHWKLSLMFVTVLLVPIINKNQNFTVYWTDFLIKPFKDKGSCIVISEAYISDLSSHTLPSKTDTYMEPNLSSPHRSWMWL